MALVVKRQPTSEGARDVGSIPRSGRFPWSRKWQPTPVFLPGKAMDRGAWWAAVHGVAKRWTQLKRHSTHSTYLADLTKRINSRQEKSGEVHTLGWQKASWKWHGDGFLSQSIVSSRQVSLFPRPLLRNAWEMIFKKPQEETFGDEDWRLISSEQM